MKKSYSPINLDIFVKIAVSCPDFKWLGFRITGPIWNPDHLQTNLLLTIQNPDLSGFQILTVFLNVLMKWMVTVLNYLNLQNLKSNEYIEERLIVKNKRKSWKGILLQKICTV